MGAGGGASLALPKCPKCGTDNKKLRAKGDLSEALVVKVAMDRIKVLPGAAK